jgi:DNA-binding transcriptional ArsR family regulator
VLRVPALPRPGALEAILLRKPDYLAILSCIDRPKLVTDVIMCVIESGRGGSPSTIRTKILSLERMGVVETERMGKYVTVSIKKGVQKAIQRLLREAQASSQK